MHTLPSLRTRLMATYFASTLLALMAVLGACGSAPGKAVKEAGVTCAKAVENQLVSQATRSLITAASKDPNSVGAFLDALALDAAQVGITDAIGYVTCVAEAVKAELVRLAGSASMDPVTYRLVMNNLATWELTHPVSARGD